MTDLVWFLTALLAVLLAEAGGAGYQRLTRHHNQQGEATDA